MKKLFIRYSSISGIGSAVFAFLFLFLFLAVPVAVGCTGFRIESEDGFYYRGRTMEFAADIPSDVIVIPRGQTYTGTTMSGEPGMEWSTVYAAVGANGFGLPMLVDGVNEEGLSAAMFYFANYVGYQEETEDKSHVLAPYEVCTWILTSFSSVQEVRESIEEIVVPPVVLEAFGYAPPIHFIVMDRTGECIVLEHVNGELIIYENPLGVITNSPTFDWHLTNLNNHLNLTPVNVSPYEIEGVPLRELGQGSGMLGLPGDFTPPSRFVRAAMYSASALPVESGTESVLKAFHILNQFDIPIGACRRPTVNDEAPQCEYTLWSSVTDLERSRYYLRTYDNSRIRMVDLMALDLEGDEILCFKMDTSEDIQDLTGDPVILQ